MKNQNVLTITILSLIVIFSTSSTVFAHPHHGQIQINNHTHQPQTEYVPISGLIGLEKTSLIFHASPDNTLPWGFVEGKISNPVAGYPVIIQIFDDEGAFHFAQTSVNEDGNYEYKFRVLNMENGEAKKIFEGDYYVAIFKVVYLNQENLV